jgi:hypothetical protein
MQSNGRAGMKPVKSKVARAWVEGGIMEKSLVVQLNASEQQRYKMSYLPTDILDIKVATFCR